MNKTAFRVFASLKLQSVPALSKSGFSACWHSSTSWLATASLNAASNSFPSARPVMADIAASNATPKRNLMGTCPLSLNVRDIVSSSHGRHVVFTHFHVCILIDEVSRLKKSRNTSYALREYQKLRHDPFLIADIPLSLYLWKATIPHQFAVRVSVRRILPCTIPPNQVHCAPPGTPCQTRLPQSVRHRSSGLTWKWISACHI